MRMTRAAIALDSKRAGVAMDFLRKLTTGQDACIATIHGDVAKDRFDTLCRLPGGRLDNN